MSDKLLEKLNKEPDTKEHISEKELSDALKEFSAKDRKELGQVFEQSPELHKTMVNAISRIVSETLHREGVKQSDTIKMLQLYRLFVDKKQDTIVDGLVGPQTQEYVLRLQLHDAYPALSWEYLTEHQAVFLEANKKTQQLYHMIQQLHYPEFSQLLTQIDRNTLRKELVLGNHKNYETLKVQIIKMQNIDRWYQKTVGVAKQIESAQQQITTKEKEKSRLSQEMYELQSRVGSDLNDLTRWDFSSADDRKADQTFTEIQDVITKLDVINNQIFSLEKNTETQKIQLLLYQYEFIYSQGASLDQKRQFLVDVSTDLNFSQIIELGKQAPKLGLKQDLYNNIFQYRSMLLTKYYTNVKAQNITPQSIANAIDRDAGRFAGMTPQEKKHVMIFKFLPWNGQLSSTEKQRQYIDQVDIKEQPQVIEKAIINSEIVRSTQTMAHSLHEKLQPLLTIVSQEKQTEKIVDTMRNVFVNIDIQQIRTALAEFGKQKEYLETMALLLPDGSMQKRLFAVFGQVHEMEKFFGPKGIFDKMKDYVTNPAAYKDSSFSTWMKTEGVIILGTIVIATATVMTAGATGIVGMAARGAIGGMIGQRFSQLGADVLNSTVWVSEVEQGSGIRTLKYNNPTDFQKFVQGELAGKEFVEQLSTEFISSALTTSILLGTGKILGGAISSMKPGVAKKALETITFKLNDALSNKMPRQVARVFGNNAMMLEMIQEIRQEAIGIGVEKGTKDTDLELAGQLVNLLFCITPRKKSILDFDRFGMSVEKPFVDKQSHEIVQSIVYNDPNFSFETAQKYAAEKGMHDVQQNPDGSISMEYSTDGQKVRVEFVPTKEPLLLRVMPDFRKELKALGIKLGNYEASKLNEITLLAQKYGLFCIPVENGVVITNGKEQLMLEKQKPTGWITEQIIQKLQTFTSEERLQLAQEPIVDKQEIFGTRDEEGVETVEKTEQQKLVALIMGLSSSRDPDRVRIAGALLGEEIAVDSERGKLIIQAHNETSMIKKGLLLRKGGFDAEQTKVLMRWGVCGMLVNPEVIEAVEHPTTLSVHNNETKEDDLFYNKIVKEKLKQTSIAGSLDINIQKKLENQETLTKDELVVLETTVKHQVEELYKEAEYNHELCKTIMEEIGRKTRALDIISNVPLKKQVRIVDKVIKECDGHIEQITDIVRGTIVFNTVNDIQNALVELTQMPEVKKLTYKDRLDDSKAFHKNCRDVLINVQLDNGFVFEVQFHLPEILRLKDPELFDKQCKNSNNILNRDNNLYNQIDHFASISSQRSQVDHLILGALNNEKKREKKLLQYGDKMATHDLYDVSRELPQDESALNSGNYRRLTDEGFQREDINDLKKRIDSTQEAINTYGIEKYNERTKDNYIPSEYTGIQKKTLSSK